MLCDFDKSIMNTLHELCGNLKGKSFLVALSGGADSVSLFLSMLNIGREYGFSLYACHVNHMIRGDEADRDQVFCETLCAKNSVRLFVEKADIPSMAEVNGESIELCARNYRYMIFDKICDEHNIDYICTAHNANDNAETVLFNIIRGTGLKGICGIPRSRDRIIRPLLNKTRDAILAYLEDMTQSYVTDSTNCNIDYTRNYIRNVLLRDAITINSEVVCAINRLSIAAKQDCDFLNDIAASEAKEKTRKLSEYPNAIKSRIIKLKFSEVSNESLSFRNIIDLCEMLDTPGESRCSLPGGINAFCSYGNLSFESNTDSSVIVEKNLQLGVNDVCDGVKIIAEISKRKGFNAMSASLSMNININSLTVRSRKEGDKFTVRGINRTVKKCFIDKKIPAFLRDSIPVVCDSEGIVFVPFIGVADRAFEKDSCLRLTVLFDERFGF